MKSTPEICSRVEEITRANRNLSCIAIAQAITDSSDQLSISSTTIFRIRRNLGFNFLPPIATFSLNIAQIVRRLQFAQHHLTEGTDWSKTLFTDESSFILGDRRWIWRRRGETGPEVSSARAKYPVKVMIFAGVGRDYKSRPILVESGTVDANSYVDEFVDQNAVIPEMDARHGVKH
jgi:hypothetical protein